jgi:hypothetical protein
VAALEVEVRVALLEVLGVAHALLPQPVQEQQGREVPAVLDGQVAVLATLILLGAVVVLVLLGLLRLNQVLERAELGLHLQLLEHKHFMPVAVAAVQIHPV